MQFLNVIFNFIFNILLYPFQKLPQIWGLVFVSVVTGLVMIRIFKKVSNQEKIKHIKTQLKADLLEMRLYQYDTAVMLRTVKNLFTDNGRYIFQILRPMIFLMVPVTLIMIQLSSRYSNEPISTDETAVVSLKYSEDTNPRTISLKSNQGVIVETAPVRILEERSIFWRIRGGNPGVWPLNFVYESSDSLQIPVNVETGSPQLTVQANRKNNILTLLYPAGPVLPENEYINQVRVNYPESLVPVAGLHIHWLILFFLLSIISGLIFKVFFKVDM